VLEGDGVYEMRMCRCDDVECGGFLDLVEEDRVHGMLMMIYRVMMLTMLAFKKDWVWWRV
jgi:hypothetical protein